jgi:hypothetical protein
MSQLEISPPTFNKLAQLMPNPERDLLKKAKRKALTTVLSLKLMSLKNGNEKAYRNMYYCNSLLSQDGQELKTSYCKSRFCSVCNAIKTANLINGYLPELQNMANPHFMTLTIKAVGGKQLKPAIDRMQKDFRAILLNFAKYKKLKIKAIRKLECNFNDEKKTFNPHFHLIIEGRDNAELLRAAWLELNPRSNLKGQDIRPADMDSMVELFKYATKIITKGKIHIKAMDKIFSALRRKRVIQPIGIKKFVDEDEREKVIYTGLTEDQTQWSWEDGAFDWINTQTGECLTGFTPDIELKLLYEQLRE